MYKAIERLYSTYLALSLSFGTQIASVKDLCVRLLQPYVNFQIEALGGVTNLIPGLGALIDR